MVQVVLVRRHEYIWCWEDIIPPCRKEDLLQLRRWTQDLGSERMDESLNEDFNGYSRGDPSSRETSDLVRLLYR